MNVMVDINAVSQFSTVVAGGGYHHPTKLAQAQAGSGKSTCALHMRSVAALSTRVAS